MIVGVIVAYGKSRRMKQDKLMLTLANKPVLQHSLDSLLANSAIEQLILVTPQARFEHLLLSADQSNRISRIDGGESRQTSVQAALEHIQIHHPEAQSVLIHDGARPLLSQKDLASVIDASYTYPAVSLATRVTDTIKQQDSQGLSHSIDRESLWAMQTPQIFHTQILIQAYAKAQQDSITLTDEISAIEHLHQPVHFVPATSFNLKLTSPADWQLAQAWLKLNA